MRNSRQIEKRRKRTQAANELLGYLDRDGIHEGVSVIKKIIEPYSERYGIDKYDCWRAYNILVEAGRIKASTGGKFDVLSLLPIIFLEDGSIK